MIRSLFDGTRLNDDGSISDVIKDEVVCVLETL